MINLQNYVKITALAGLRSKLAGGETDEDLMMLLRVMRYTASISDTLDQMQNDGDPDVKKLYSEETLKALFKELDVALTAEGF